MIQFLPMDIGEFLLYIYKYVCMYICNICMYVYLFVCNIYIYEYIGRKIYIDNWIYEYMDIWIYGYMDI